MVSASRSFRVGSHAIGGGRCFVIAEAGVNHNGDAALAHRLVDAAADAGADAVKFQTFDPEALVAAATPKARYQIEQTGGDESQLDMLRRLALPRAAHLALAEHARDRGLLFLSTAFDEASADFLFALGIPAFKIPSGEVTNHLLVAHVARLGRPMLLSTGMATLAEVEGAVACVRAHTDAPLALFHCVTNYPAAPEDCNLRAMATMRAHFGVPTGWSDHTAGNAISLAAVAAGAELLEKHFTLDRTLPGPDHAASLEPDELRALVDSVRLIERALGTGEKVPAASERENALLVRRSLHARRALPAGHVLAATDLAALRPGTGVPPSALATLVGATLRRPVDAGAMLTPDDLA